MLHFSLCFIVPSIILLLSLSLCAHFGLYPFCYELGNGLLSISHFVM
jgi:hypothetical protein